jgi:hypothetical protein
MFTKVGWAVTHQAGDKSPSPTNPGFKGIWQSP